MSFHYLSSDKRYFDSDKIGATSNELINCFTQENETEITNSEYFTPSEFKNLNIDCKINSLFLHLNISSLSYYIDSLKDFLAEIKTPPKIIAISESRVKSNKEPLSQINIPGYTIEQTPTDSGKGGALLYISTELRYKIRKDLIISKSKELESVFIEIVNEKKKKRI